MFLRSSGRRPSRLVASRRAPQGDGTKLLRHRARWLRSQSPDQEGQLIEVALQEFPRALVADIAVRVDQVRLKRDVGFAALEDRTQADHHRAQMLLGNGAADRARRGAGDEGRLAAPRVLAP